MMRRYFLLFIFPIFLYSSSEKIIEKAISLKLYETNEWKALLHYNDNLNIKDRSFILSDDFSLKNEMITTINSFFISKENYKNINEHPQCKYPSRLLFITHELNLSKNDFPKINCKDFSIYQKKAPANTISLIYASENVKNPSSMMGHTFLKFSGKNHQNIEKEHAITFYTIIETVNLFKLLYQNIISGMKGLFALQPYKKMITQYTKNENRNVWEYQLNLSEYRKKLIYYHIWELKNIEMQYFFTSYNCSTVIYYLLSLVNPKIYDKQKLWITPLDTVKFLYQYDLIDKSELLPSDEWLVKMTSENLSNYEIINVKNIVDKNNHQKINHLEFKSLKLLESYINLQYKTNKISIKKYQPLNKRIQENLKYNNEIFDISNYKSPNKIPNERQIGIGYKNIEKENFLKLSFLPASHLINDNNKEYFGESELKIGYLSVLLKNNKVQLDEFTLYGMKSYMPYDSLTNDLSYQLELSIKKEYARDMNYENTFKFSGGFGVDFSIKKDINAFAMINLGIGYNKDDESHLFLNPQVGAMIYEVFNMKSLFYYQPLFVNNDKLYDKFVLEHNIFLSNDYKLYFNIEQINNDIKDKRNYEFGIIKLF